MAQFETSSSSESGRTIVRLVGECDLTVRDELTTALLSAIDGSPLVVVDLTELSFLDSSGLNGFVTAYHAARDKDGWLYVINAGGVVAELLAMTGIGDLLSPPVSHD
jgi:anti-anti-sigma factor